jgi:hypothetical protein
LIRCHVHPTVSKPVAESGIVMVVASGTTPWLITEAALPSKSL